VTDTPNSEMGGDERFCFCGGMATTNDRLERCRVRADEVIGGPLRARLAELEAEPERAKRLAVGFVEVSLATAVSVPEVARAVAEFDEERLRAVAECDRLRKHSIQLNTIAYRLADALGMARDGQPVDADPMALVDQVLDDRAGYRARAESAGDQIDGARIAELEKALRQVLGELWERRDLGPDGPCRKSGWIPETTLARWYAVVTGKPAT
jgi:hypothetical protein